MATLTGSFGVIEELTEQEQSFRDVDGREKAAFDGRRRFTLEGKAQCFFDVLAGTLRVSGKIEAHTFFAVHLFDAAFELTGLGHEARHYAAGQEGFTCQLGRLLEVAAIGRERGAFQDYRIERSQFFDRMKDRFCAGQSDESLASQLFELLPGVAVGAVGRPGMS
jgi:hypothetical protein